MTEWSEWPDADAATTWDAAVVRLPNHTFYQAYGWGEFKRRAGWIPRRAAVVIDGTVAALAQCLVREVRVARTVIVWVPGGPAGDRGGLLSLGAALRRRYRGWRLWVRVNAACEEWPGYEGDFAAAGWRRAAVPVGHPFTFQIDLTRDATERRAALSQNWRHNLSRGDRRGGCIRQCGADEPLGPAYAVYREVVERKSLQDGMHLADLEAVRALCGSAFQLAVACDEAGAPVAMRGFMRFGARADDFVSGVSEEGRRRYSNYLLTWRTIELAAAQGATTYDMAGADAVRAPRVHDFKRGLGGRPVRLAGEWEWQTSRWLGWAVGRTIGRRARAQEEAGQP